MNEGILVVNKPSNITSRDVINKLNHIFHMQKIGHTGTLDPLATGVLIVCLGKATKLVDFLVNDEKEYKAAMQLGIKTDTYDITGNILETKPVSITKDDIFCAFNHFEGEYEQEVPAYSAVKVNGKKLYEYARQNIDIILPKRVVNIKSLELLDFKDNIVSFKVLVSKGTYIRSLINDIGNYLGCNAIMVNLNRTRQGMFTLEESYSLDDIENNKFKVLNIAQVLENYPKKVVQGEELKKIKNGAVVKKKFTTEYLIYYERDNPIAIYQEYAKDKSMAKPYIML